jgi:hypothetical protein
MIDSCSESPVDYLNSEGYLVNAPAYRKQQTIAMSLAPFRLSLAHIALKGGLSIELRPYGEDCEAYITCQLRSDVFRRGGRLHRTIQGEKGSVWPVGQIMRHGIVALSSDRVGRDINVG